MPYVTFRYERSKLYAEVWAEAVTTVAKRYGLSDVALRKICRQLAVPLPPLGYWAKIAAGKKPPTPPLPRYSGPTEIVGQRYVSDGPVEPDPEHLVARREFEAKPENRIVVSETLDTPHSLVAATERALRRPKSRDARALPATERRALDVAVSEASLPRALRILDALLKALDARGMPVRIEPDGKRHAEHLERQHRHWEEQERLRREREERQRKEIERLKGLEQEAGNWKRAQQIRAYAAAAEAKQMQERGAVDAGSEFGLWLAWARHKADWTDPLIRAHCEVLDGQEQQEEE